MFNVFKGLWEAAEVAGGAGERNVIGG
jgi:hypothetical protein